MDEFGWLLFGLGALLIVVFGVIGVDAGNVRVANLSGMIAGMSFMVSGAVFVIGGRLEKRMPKSETQIAESSAETAIADALVETAPVEITAPKVEDSALLSPTAQLMVLAVIFIGVAVIIGLFLVPLLLNWLFR